MFTLETISYIKTYDMNNYDIKTRYMAYLHYNYFLITACTYVLDKKDLNIVRLRRSAGQAILHTQFQRGTIRLKKDDWKALVLHDGTLSTSTIMTNNPCRFRHIYNLF